MNRQLTQYGPNRFCVSGDMDLTDSLGPFGPSRDILVVRGGCDRRFSETGCTLKGNGGVCPHADRVAMKVASVVVGSPLKTRP